MVTKPAKPVKTVKISRPTKSTLKQSTKPTLREVASPRQTLSKSLGAIASNKGLKKSDAKGTAQNRINNASKNLETAKANYRAAANEAKKTKVTNSAINNTESVRNAKIKMDNARKILNSEYKTYKKYLK